MEKDQLQADRLTQLLDETRRMFRARLDEVSELNEEQWADENLLDELNKALALLENVRSDYNKALAKIDAIHPHAPTGAAAAARPLTFEEAPGLALEGAQGFGYWLRAGLAFTLPLMALLVLLALIWMAFTYYWA
jgi:hypothetical protein